MDEATLDRLAEAAWDLRCQRMAEAEDGPKFMPGTWAARPEHLKATDRAVVALVADEAVTMDRRKLGRIAALARNAVESTPQGGTPGVNADLLLALIGNDGGTGDA